MKSPFGTVTTDPVAFVLQKQGPTVSIVRQPFDDGLCLPGSSDTLIEAELRLLENAEVVEQAGRSPSLLLQTMSVDDADILLPSNSLAMNQKTWEKFSPNILFHNTAETIGNWVVMGTLGFDVETAIPKGRILINDHLENDMVYCIYSPVDSSTISSGPAVIFVHEDRFYVQLQSVTPEQFAKTGSPFIKVLRLD